MSSPLSRSIFQAPSAPVRRILIVRLSALGDILHALPALPALREAFPEAELSWVVEPIGVQVLQGHPDLDQLYVLPRKEWARRLRQPWQLPRLADEAWRFFRRLRRQRFDLALDFQGNMRSGVVTWLSGARRRLGYAPEACSEGFGALFTNRWVRPLRERQHRVEKAMQLLRGLGLNGEARPRVPTLEVGDSPQTLAREFLQDAFAHAHPGPLVLIHPGTSSFGHIKEWALEHFAAVADTLIAECRARVLLSWGPGEKERVETVRRAMATSRPEQVTVCPRTDLSELIAFLEHCDLVIGVDTGPVHLAAAMGRPTLGVYGPKDPIIYGPWGRRSRTVVTATPPDCMPCNLHRCPFSERRCMTTLRPERVSRAALEQLASPSPLPPRTVI